MVGHEIGLAMILHSPPAPSSRLSAQLAVFCRLVWQELFMVVLEPGRGSGRHQAHHSDQAADPMNRSDTAAAFCGIPVTGGRIRSCPRNVCPEDARAFSYTSFKTVPNF